MIPLNALLGPARPWRVTLNAHLHKHLIGALKLIGRPKVASKKGTSEATLKPLANKGSMK